MEANVFELSNENIRILYTAQGNAGQPTLTYEDPEIDRTFHAPDIRILNTDIGQQVTVTLEKGVDTGTRALTLLVPTVTVSQAGDRVPLRTKAIVTTFSKIAGANLVGADQRYRTESLHGTAQFVFTVSAADNAARARGA